MLANCSIQHIILIVLSIQLLICMNPQKIGRKKKDKEVERESNDPSLMIDKRVCLFFRKKVSITRKVEHLSGLKGWPQEDQSLYKISGYQNWHPMNAQILGNKNNSISPPPKNGSFTKWTSILNQGNYRNLDTSLPCQLSFLSLENHPPTALCDFDHQSQTFNMICKTSMYTMKLWEHFHWQMTDH